MTTVITDTSQTFGVLDIALNVVFTSESAQDLCRNIVHSDLASGVLRGAFIYALNNRSNLSATAGYGEHFTEGLNEISAWDDNPASNAIRNKVQVFDAGEKDLRPAVLAIPLLKERMPTGVLVLLLAPGTQTSPISEQVTSTISKLVSYFIETKVNAAKPAGHLISGKESVEDLTTRQLAILTLMGDGLTNAEISSKVLLSESTVRQETIRIYRALAVSGRQDAVAKGRALGLIATLSLNAPQQSS